jgi:hypothetical protein
VPGDALDMTMWELGDDADRVEYRARQWEELGEYRRAARERMTSRADEMTRRYAKFLVDKKTFQVGQFVLRKNRRKTGLQPGWLGPYAIRRIEPFGTYELVTPHGQVLDALVHHDELKECLIPTLDMARRKWYEGVGFRRMDRDADGEAFDGGADEERERRRLEYPQVQGGENVGEDEVSELDASRGQECGVAQQERMM